MMARPSQLQVQHALAPSYIKEAPPARKPKQPRNCLQVLADNHAWLPGCALPDIVRAVHDHLQEISSHGSQAGAHRSSKLMVVCACPSDTTSNGTMGLASMSSKPERPEAASCLLTLTSCYAASAPPSRGRRWLGVWRSMENRTLLSFGSDNEEQRLSTGNIYLRPPRRARYRETCRPSRPDTSHGSLLTSSKLPFPSHTCAPGTWRTSSESGVNAQTLPAKCPASTACFEQHQATATSPRTTTAFLISDVFRSSLALPAKPAYAFCEPSEGVLARGCQQVSQMRSQAQAAWKRIEGFKVRHRLAT